MRRSFRFIAILAAALAAAVLVASLPAMAGEGRVPMPELWKGKGDKCLEPTDVMRRYHMNYLKHQREDTLYRGIRGTKYSMKTCIECHAVADPNNKVDQSRSVEHFCYQCHQYAAVWIDCFECHAHKLPDENAQGGAAK
ncbi:MAG: Hdr-like menaquinol oxidoreductase cytochrome c subunit [Magnetospirillum sp. WYHS-4]